MVEECMDGVRVVAILSWRLDWVRLFLERSVGICTAIVRSGGEEGMEKPTIHELSEVCILVARC